MARNSTDKWNDLNDIANINMMIAGASGQGGSPGQSYRRPLQNPDPGEAVFGVEKGGQTFFEFLKAMGIDPANDIKKTGGGLGGNDKGYGENETPGRTGWQIAHGEGRGPQAPYHDEYNRELKIAPWMQMFPDGTLREIPWMKEEYLKEHPELAGASSRQIRDRLKPFTRGKGYDSEGGSLQGVPDALRIQLLRDAMAKAPANSRTNFRPLGWRTDYTGSFRVEDDGKLKPQMYLHKIKA